MKSYCKSDQKFDNQNCLVAPWTALEDVTAESGANIDGSLSNDRPNLKFNPEFNPNALVGKATCIQLKPAGRIVCFDWQYFQIWQHQTSTLVCPIDV